MCSMAPCWRLRACTSAGTDMTQLFQALKKAFSDGNFSWQRPDTDTSHADTDTSHADVSSGVPSDLRCNSFLSDEIDPEAARRAYELAQFAR